jgi:hypothetical protein
VIRCDDDASDAEAATWLFQQRQLSFRLRRKGYGEIQDQPPWFSHSDTTRR